MHYKDERTETFASWMIASGARLDQPDPRRLSHLVALRDARRETARSHSAFSRLAGRFDRPARLAATPAAPSTIAICCSPA